MMTEGLPRSYFYSRLAEAMREVASRTFDARKPHPPLRIVKGIPRVVKINMQETLDRLTRCPVCGQPLVKDPSYPQERSCPAGCGDFTISEVHWDGDVTFEFKMVIVVEDSENKTDAPNRGTDARAEDGSDHEAIPRPLHQP